MILTLFLKTMSLSRHSSGILTKFETRQSPSSPLRNASQLAHGLMLILRPAYVYLLQCSPEWSGCAGLPSDLHGVPDSGCPILAVLN